MSTKEIITLQLGHYANFVGTHWWNIQESNFEYGNANGVGHKEEIDHDVLFREGLRSRGEVTFTPRLVLTELKGGLGSLRSSGVLYDDCDSVDPSVTTWHGETSVYRQPKEKRNEYLADLENPRPASVTENSTWNGVESQKTYNLDKNVRVWSDYLRTFLHPKSTVIINEYQHNSQNDPFDLWSKGASLKQSIEELEERIRFYAEECDLLQGFHVLADSDNGFAGLTSSLLPHLHDEFSSKRVITFPVRPVRYCEDTIVKSNKRKLNDASFLPVVLEHSSLVCPLSLDSGTKCSRTFPHLIYDVNLSYHTSAIIASALDTFTMNYRLKGNAGVTLACFCEQLVTSSKNLVGTSLVMPLPLSCLDNHALSFREFLSNHLVTDPWTFITPGIEPTKKTVVEHYTHAMTVRGISSKTMQIPRKVASEAFGNVEFQDVLQHFLDTKFRGSRNHAHIREHLLKTMAPFPQIFNEEVIENGSVAKQYLNGQHSIRSRDPQPRNAKINGHSAHMPKHKPQVSTVPILVGLESSSRLSDIFKSAATLIRSSHMNNPSFVWMESENLKSEIEYLLSREDEYKDDKSDSIHSDDSL